MTTTLNENGLSSNDYIRMIKVFAITLNEHRDVMNALNVFPVPDADTGTNMYISIKGIQDNINPDQFEDFNLLSKHIADLALLSAQGNSGLLIAQLFRGIHKSMTKSKTLGLNEFVDALESSYEFAQSSVYKPEEGTIITVMRECAQVAKEYSKYADANLETVFEAVIERAKLAVGETKEQMELLKRADVVDSGAYGFSVMLEAAFNCLERDDSGNLSIRIDGTHSFVPDILEHNALDKSFFEESSHDGDWGYCTVFALTGDSLNVEVIKEELSNLGRSVVVSGSDTVCKIHVHVEDPEEVLRTASKFGDISNKNITNMDEQYKEMREQILSQHSDEISLIVITEGKGIEGFLKDNTYGSLKIVKTSDFLKMPLEDFADKVSDISSKSKIIVSNNEEDYQKILNFYGQSNKDVIIIGTKNDAELVSAILSFSPEQDVEGNIFGMKDAVSSTTSIVIHPSQLQDKNALINFLVEESGLEMSNTFISLFLSESLDVDQIAHLNELLLEDLGVAEVETITCDSKKWDILISVE